jgi:hypothetical protein
MKKNSMIAIVTIILLGGVIGVYVYLRYNQPQPETTQIEVPPPAPVAQTAPAPLVQQVIETPTAPSELPDLDDSDKLMVDTVATLLQNKSLLLLFYDKQIIRKWVATIDSLPRSRVPVSMRPVKRVNGQFIAEGAENHTSISIRNAARYSAYMKIAEVIDSQKLVDVYVRLYPLFQQAYKELGYPKMYFNDRLLLVIDNLLAAPDIKEPIMLIRPKVFYLFADPKLEACSAGQKIMRRIGNANEEKIKTKLRDIKQQMMLHMRNKKVEALNK